MSNPSNTISSIQTHLTDIFQTIDPLRDLLDETLNGWEPPIIVVFGDESAGKSTILERIAMLPIFPKGKGLCTRLCIRVVLRNSHDEHEPELYVMKRNPKTNRFERHDGPGVLSLDEGEEVIRQKMLETLEIEHAQSKGISQNMRLELRLSGPTFPNLDLLDVPGLVLNTANNQEPELPQQTRTLLESVIQETAGRAVYLMIRPHDPEFKNSNAFTLFTQIDTLQASNTINVTTKWDEVAGRAMPDKIERELNSPENNQFYASIFTSNPPESSLQKQANEETMVFQEPRISTLVKAHSEQFGTNALVEQISHLYTQFLRSDWYPTTASHIHREDEAITDRVHNLGLPPVEQAEDVTPELLAQITSTLFTVQQDSLTKSLSKLISQTIQPCLTELRQAIDQYTKTQHILEITSQFQHHPNSLFWHRISTTIEQCIETLLQEKYDIWLKSIESDTGDGDPTTPLRLGRFTPIPKILRQHQKDTLHTLRQHYRKTSEQIYQQHQHSLLEYNWSKQTVKRSKDGCQRLLQAIEHLLGTVLSVSFSNQQIREALEAVPTEKWIENCVGQRQQLYERKQNLHLVSQKLYDIFGFDTSEALQRHSKQKLMFTHTHRDSNSQYDCVWTSEPIYTKNHNWELNIDIKEHPQIVTYFGFCPEHHVTRALYRDSLHLVFALQASGITTPSSRLQLRPNIVKLKMFDGQLTIQHGNQQQLFSLPFTTTAPFRFFIEEFHTDYLPTHVQSLQIV